MPETKPKAKREYKVFLLSPDKKHNRTMMIVAESPEKAKQAANRRSASIVELDWQKAVNALAAEKGVDAALVEDEVERDDPYVIESCEAS